VVQLESVGDGAYRIVEVLGQGGFGTVYKAHQASLDRLVAIKVLREDYVRSAADMERFRREARAAARLGGHPNIVTIYDYGEHGGLAYLVLEYIDGPTLQARLREPLAPAEVVPIVRAVASALDHAHSQGLVHRDVKPSNIMLARDGRVVLTDFGIVKLLDRDGPATLAGPATTGALGTPGYMAPEQVVNGQIGPATDLYALGVVCFELLAGGLPFNGPPLSIMHQQVNSLPPSFAALGRSVSPAAEQVVRQALAKQPEQRFRTGSELVSALEQALGGASVAAEPNTLPTELLTGLPAAPAPAARPAPRPLGGGWLIGVQVVLNLLLLAYTALALGGAFSAP
jgi:eukaryotic-like serine/threonine-protein kinase